MKKIVALICVLACLCGAVACAPGSSRSALAVKDWVDAQIENNTLLSFTYGGQDYASHIGSWEKTVEATDAGYTVTYKKDGVRLWSEIKIDTEANSVEWVHYFKNEAQADSAVISNIRALDASVEFEAPILTGANGCNRSYAEYEAFTVNLAEEGEYFLEETSGYSSRDRLPYWDLCNGERGVMGAIGWSGDWTMQFTHNEGQVHMAGGMLQTVISLHADEQMRTPSIVLQFFEGDQDAGHNGWRQLMLKSYTQTDAEGQPLRELPIAFNVWGGSGAESIIRSLARVEDGIFDTLWIDAGWYGEGFSSSDGGQWQNSLGDWFLSKEKYPRGLSEVGEVTDNMGLDLLLWLEFERAVPSSKLYREHPEYFMTASIKSNVKYKILNLADDEVTDYVIDMLYGFLVDAGAEWYRTDSGSFPRYDWREMDAKEGENRTGITEIKWITNFYRVFDTLKERIPGLMVDNCAGGGRRLDVEMLRRGTPLWRTDYSIGEDSDDDAVRYIAANLTWWVPLSCGGAANFEYNDSLYAWRSMFGTGLTLSLKVDTNWLAQFKQCRKLMLDDYYILTNGYKDVISVYEFFVPETDEGYLIAFRPADCQTAKVSFVLKGLDPKTTYQLDNMDTGASSTKTGEELMEEGLKLTIPQAETSHIITIKAK